MAVRFTVTFVRSTGPTIVCTSLSVRSAKDNILLLPSLSPAALEAFVVSLLLVTSLSIREPPDCDADGGTTVSKVCWDEIESVLGRCCIRDGSCFVSFTSK